MQVSLTPFKLFRLQAVSPTTDKSINSTKMIFFKGLSLQRFPFPWLHTRQRIASGTFGHLILVSSLLMTSGCALFQSSPEQDHSGQDRRELESVGESAHPSGARSRGHAEVMSLESRVAHLLPQRVQNPSAWARDISTAFTSLKIPPTTENICASLAVIEQESSFRAEPAVPGLPGIIRKELKRRQEKYGVPDWMMNKALEIQSPKGGTYHQRIDALKTENDVNRLYEDMISELPLGRQLLGDFNPVKTGGPMQVSVVAAKEQLRKARYPYPYSGDIRDEVFSRRGGLYFGIAYLLSYPIRYNDIAYRFADYNAGHYASRNAAFQKAVRQLSGRQLELDGDLLRYQNGKPSASPSETFEALHSLESKLAMDQRAIQRDLLLEKTPGFSATPLYQQIDALAGRGANNSVSHEEMPIIQLHSPKFSRGLTTAMFAQRVKERYQSCLERGGR
jgi:hypothetical protein